MASFTEDSLPERLQIEHCAAATGFISGNACDRGDQTGVQRRQRCRAAQHALGQFIGHHFVTATMAAAVLVHVDQLAGCVKANSAVFDLAFDQAAADPEAAGPGPERTRVEAAGDLVGLVALLPGGPGVQPSLLWDIASPEGGEEAKTRTEPREYVAELTD